VANGWGGSGGTAVSLLGTFGVLGSAARGRSPSAWRLSRLRTRLPSTRVGLTRATVLGRTRSATVVGNVPITLRRRLAVGTRWNHGGGVGRVTRTGWWHAWLTVTHHTASTRGWEVAAGRVVHRTVHVATRNASGGGLLHADLVALSDLALQLLPTNLTALGEGDVERLRTDHLVVHLGNGLGGLLRIGVTNETEALGMVLIVAHDLGTGNGSKRLELGTEFFVVDVVVEILDVQVYTLILAQLLHLGLLVRLAQLFLTFGLLLCPGDEKLLAVVLAVVECIDSFGSVDVVLVVDKSKALALSLSVDLEDGRGDRSKLGEQILELLLRDLSVQVLDVDVGELFLLLINFGHAFLIIKLGK